jgi:hypothetical protein
MKNINKRTILLATLFFGILLIPSFLGAWAEDEGTLGKSMIWLTFAKLFNFLRFPTHTLFWTFFSEFGATIYFLGLLINCIFYGFVIERIINIFNFKRLKILKKYD